MSGHTPGPWTNEDFTITADDGSVISDVHSIDDFPCIDQDNDADQLEKLNAELQANARLIAAAPDLLEALIKLTNESDGFMHLASAYKEVFGVTNIEVLRRRIDEGRVAIAKAEGK